jgi:hypothetical protein
VSSWTLDPGPYTRYPDMDIIPYKDQYDPGLLCPVPRAPHRRELGIEGALPFAGVDVWSGRPKPVPLPPL